MQTLVVADPLADLARLEGVPSGVASALAAVDAVLRDRGLRAVPPDRAAQALLSGARGTAALTDDPPTWLPGAVRLSTELGSLAAVVRVSPAQALARAHVLAARGVVPDADLGRIGGAGGTQPRMAGVVELLTRTSSASAVVLGAVVHAELATLEPFGSADGLVARAAEHLVLIAGGVDPRGLIPVEAGHADDPERYRDALAGYATGSLAGVRDWLLHCVAALSRGAELSSARGRP